MDPVLVSPPLPAHEAQLGPVKEAGLRNGYIQKLCADQVQFLLWRFAHIGYIVEERESFLAELLSQVEIVMKHYRRQNELWRSYRQ